MPRLYTRIQRRSRLAATGLLIAIPAGSCEDGTSPRPDPKPTPTESVILTPARTTVPALDTIMLAAKVRDATGKVIESPSVTWTSSDTAVATVASFSWWNPWVRLGTVLGVSPGSATITATSGTAIATARITVGPPVAVASVTVTPGLLTLTRIGDSLRLAVSLRDSAGHVLLPRAMAWGSDNEAVATVDSTGQVRAVSVGLALVTATREDVSDTSSIRVDLLLPVASVTVTPGSDTLSRIGDTLQLAVSLRDSAGHVIPPRPMSWSSNNGAVATVDSAGLVRAVGEGSATVTATREGASGTAAITVGPLPLASVTVMPRSRTFDRIGDTSQLAVTLRDANGHVLLPRPIAWSSDNAAVATADPTGLVRAVGLGSTTVTATCEGVSGTATITVVDGVSVELAFVSTRDGNEEIYGMNADGSVQIKLTTNGGRHLVPIWSPEGTMIAFAFAFRDIYVINVDERTRSPLHVFPFCCLFNMDWSPDGQMIAVDTPNNPYDGIPNTVAVVNVAGGTASTLASGTDPVWSPDGQKIAFRSYRDGNSEIYVMNADGSTQTNLTHNAARDFDPQWSPDGEKIAFLSDRDGNLEIYVMNADGSAPINLTKNLAEDGDLQWSPAGQRIAFRSKRDGNYEIYLMNVDGAAPINLTRTPADDGDPQWSPDGQKIAFVSSRDGNWEIYVMNADGTAPTNLTNDPGGDSSPRWRP